MCFRGWFVCLFSVFVRVGSSSSRMGLSCCFSVGLVFFEELVFIDDIFVVFYFVVKFVNFFFKIFMGVG